MLLCKNKKCTKKTKCARANPKRIALSSEFGEFNEQECSFFVVRRHQDLDAIDANVIAEV